jgi:hypothetical protein
MVAPPFVAVESAEGSPSYQSFGDGPVRRSSRTADNSAPNTNSPLAIRRNTRRPTTVPIVRTAASPRNVEGEEYPARELEQLPPGGITSAPGRWDLQPIEPGEHRVREEEQAELHRGGGRQPEHAERDPED